MTDDNIESLWRHVMRSSADNCPMSFARAMRDALREPTWQQQAYARLGFARDSMTPDEVDAVQRFVGPLDT